MPTFFLFASILIIIGLNNVFAQEEENDDCDAYVDDVPHLQPVSAKNCDQLEPLKSVDPQTLNGLAWIVQYDSHAQANEKVCEFFDTRFEDGKLYTTETVQKAGTVVVLHESMTADKDKNGQFYENDDEKAVILALSNSKKTICFAECGPINKTEGQYGAHVFCATTNSYVAFSQYQIILQAERDARRMGLDITFKKMKSDCHRE